MLPVIAIAVIVREAVPTFVSVTVFAVLVTPIATVPKLKLVGETFAVVPVPLSETCCGLPTALSVTLRAALRAPLAAGLKVTLIVQLAPAASELPHVWVCAKSGALVPVIAMAMIVRDAEPVFLSVTVLTPVVVPIASVPKLTLAGERLTTGPLLVLNVAVSDLDELIVTAHAPVPVHAPLQPVNVEPAVGVSVMVTTVPLAKFAVHVPGQLIPAGLLVTVPVPFPAGVTVSGKSNLKVAVTDSDALNVTEHMPVPEQAPLQPVKTEPAATFAVKVTIVPSANPNTHLPGQLMPAGLLVTDP